MRNHIAKGHRFPDDPIKDCAWQDCGQEAIAPNEIMRLCEYHVDLVYGWEMTRRHELNRDEAIARGRRMDGAAKRSARVDRRYDEISKTRGNQPGWIYYLKVNDLVKIGFTTDIIQRMRDYPPDTPLLAVHPGTPELEREMHRIFKGSLARGREWFTPDDYVLEHCAKVVAEYGDPKKFERPAPDRNATKPVIYPKAWRGKTR